jgi:hypothetical protein
MRKNFFLIIAIFLFSTTVIAQVPQLFKYQGLARDSSGNPISNDTIALRISIHQGTPVGTVVYKETHNPITNEFGSFNINIGGGTVVTGNFSTIPWGRYNFFQEVEMDVTGGTSFVSMGTSQYLSVPYSFASDSAFYSFRSLLADSARNGIAPFWIQNTSTGNDTASVGIIVISNGGAPSAYLKNNGAGESLMVDGNVKINGTIDVNGATLNGGFTNFQVFNSSGTFTVPTGIEKVMVELWGAGGGGGGGGGGGYSNIGATGGGGGGGGYVKDILNVSPGGSITVTIGSGGNGGGGGLAGGTLSNGQNGFNAGNGGNTFFGTTTAGGGFGGDGGQGGINGGGSTGGSGGSGGNAPGLLGIVGQFGFGGNTAGANFSASSGFGGSSPNGGFGGNPGGSKTPGGGGSGGQGQYGNGNDGSSGGNGRVIVWW